MRSVLKAIIAIGCLLGALHGVLWACDPYLDPSSCQSPTTPPPGGSPYDPPTPGWPDWLHCEDGRVIAAGLGALCAYTGPFATRDELMVRAWPMCAPFTLAAECRVPRGERPALLFTHTAYRTAEGIEVRVLGQVYTRTAEIVYVVWWWSPGMVGQYGAWPRLAGSAPLCAGAGSVVGCR